MTDHTLKDMPELGGFERPELFQNIVTSDLDSLAATSESLLSTKTVYESIRNKITGNGKKSSKQKPPSDGPLPEASLSTAFAKAKFSRIKRDVLKRQFADSTDLAIDLLVKLSWLYRVQKLHTGDSKELRDIASYHHLLTDVLKDKKDSTFEIIDSYFKNSRKKNTLGDLIKATEQYIDDTQDGLIPKTENDNNLLDKLYNLKFSCFSAILFLAKTRNEIVAEISYFHSEDDFGFAHSSSELGQEEKDLLQARVDFFLSATRGIDTIVDANKEGATLRGMYSRLLSMTGSPSIGIAIERTDDSLHDEGAESEAKKPVKDVSMDFLSLPQPFSFIIY